MIQNQELNKYLLDEYGDVVYDISSSQDEKTKKIIKFYYDMTQGHVDDFNKLVEPKMKKQFYFCIIDDDTFNAYATRYNDYDIVGVNFGTISQIHSYFWKALESGIFPEIEDSEARTDLHMFLSMTALNYIIFHEIAHNFHGHNDYECNTKANFIFDMFFRKNNKIYQEQLDYKTLEMDADAFAVNKSIRPLISQLATLSNDTLKNIIKEPIDLLKYWLFSVHSFFLFFQKEIVNPNTMVFELYFPRRARQAINIGVARDIIENEHPSYLENFDCLTNEIIPFAERIFTKIFPKSKIDELEIKSLKNTKFSKHVKEVFGNWNSLHDKLIPFSRLPLPPKNNY